MATITEVLDAPNTSSTPYTITIGDTFEGSLTAGDGDAVKITLDAGDMVQITALEVGSGTSFDPYFNFRDPNNTWLKWQDSRDETSAVITFYALEAGDYTLQIKDAEDDGAADYTIDVATTTGLTDMFEVTEVPWALTTPYSIAPGQSFTGRINVNDDRDMLKVDLTEGDVVGFRVTDIFSVADLQPLLWIYDADGEFIKRYHHNTGKFSLLNFTAPETGSYYILVDDKNTDATGMYKLELDILTPPPVWTTDELAAQLTHGYWQDSGRQNRAFDISVDATISVDITGLDTDGQALATAALSVWASFTGLTFSFTSLGADADILFDDEVLGKAHASTKVSGNTITSSTVNVGKDWIVDDRANIDTYSFFTYLHEIGHAIGLGHQGDYNGSAYYSELGDGHNEALNDSRQMSIMSYFSQTKNTYVDASYGFNITPMIADLVAIQNLYASATPVHNAGDTTYDLAGANTPLATSGLGLAGKKAVAQTLFDTGGVDTFDASASTVDQRFDLNDETHSDVEGGIGNVSIARGTFLENYKGGSGSDTVLGNEFANVIEGNDGDDIIRGGGGEDALHAGEGADQLFGNSGHDTLTGGLGQDMLYGGSGNDIFVMRYLFHISGDTHNGGSGSDTLDASLFGSAGLNFDLEAGTYSASLVSGTLISVESVFGNSSDNEIKGSGAANRLEGRGGHDVLEGAAAADVLKGGSGRDSLNGGIGNDILNGGAGSDTAVFLGTQDITVNLSKATLQRTGHGRDTLLSIENATTDAGADVLVGNDANNVLSAGGGADRLQGGKGNDRLDGGGDSDVFVYRGDDGFDRIAGFQIGSDRIEIKQGANSFGRVKIVDKTSDTLIKFADTKVLLSGVDHTEISASDFLFT